jgi:DNA-binding IclR family transcriptional regulator
MTDANAVLVRMALISHGATMPLGIRRGDSGRIMPPGERRPMHEVWGERIDAAPSAGARAVVVEQAHGALMAYIRRQFVVTTAESYDELAERIVTDGWGLDADECARAMRCTPTLIKRARLDARRHPDTGYALPDETPDRMAWARALRADGLSLRDVQTLTGLPKSTLHDRLR